MAAILALVLQLTSKPIQRLWHDAVEENNKYFRLIVSNDGTVEADSVILIIPNALPANVDNGTLLTGIFNLLAALGLPVSLGLALGVR